MKVGRIVRERRKALGLTQEQVAEALGISAPAVNKWEREVSLPDITLLPPLARLLGIDLNTLLSFQENLTDGEITQFVNSLDETVQRQGYDAAFQAAREKLREFPSCDRLRYAAAMYLNGALLLYPPPDQALYQPQLEQWIQDLAESPDPEIRQAALPMLISRFRQQGELEKARQLIDSLAAPLVDKEEQLAKLLSQEQKWEEAASLWERRVMKLATDLQTALLYLMEAAEKEERRQDADSIVQVYRQMSQIVGLAPWTAYNGQFQLAVSRQDPLLCAEALENMVSSLKESWRPWETSLYRHTPPKENDLSRRLLDLLGEELEQGDDLAFLRNTPQYETLLELWQQDNA